MSGLELLFIDHGRPASRKLRMTRSIVAFMLAAVPLVAAIIFVAHDNVIRSRPVVPCMIVNSGVESIGQTLERERPYHVEVSFSFEFEHRPGFGHRLMNDFGGTGDAAAAYAEAARYVPGTTAQCAVDPTNLCDSVLVSDETVAEKLAVPVSVTGLVAIFLFYCLPQLRLAFGSASLAGKVPSKGNRASGVFAAIALLLGFGAATLYFSIIPILHTARARSWPTVPCQIESSNVQREELRGELPITLYRTDILYRYVVGINQYHSNRYCFTECSSPAAGGRIRAATRFAAGQSSVCYVDPADPTSSILSRHISPTTSFGLLPLSLASVGLLVLFSRWNNWRARSILRQNKWTIASITTVAIALMIVSIFVAP